MTEIDTDNSDSHPFEAIQFWEKKRWIYNLIALFGALAMFLLRMEAPNSFMTSEQIWLLCILLFGANIFYSAGWGTELIVRYYFRTKKWKHEWRVLLFILGSGYSCFMMFLMMAMT